MEPLTIVLIHSPLVGPATWRRLAPELRRSGFDVAVSELSDADPAGSPWWERHVASVASHLTALPRGSLLLAAHSGAGALLPAIRDALPFKPGGYVFIDAGLPSPGSSRLDVLRAEVPDFAAAFESELRAGGHYPAWTDADLAPIVPDATDRAALLAELRPRALAFWVEPLPDYEGWPDALCGYLLLSPAYWSAASEARRLGWPVREMEAGHFHMLVDPTSVAAEMKALIEEMLS